MAEAEKASSGSGISTSSPRPAGLALLGAGIFASDAYVPVLRDVKDVLVPRFVWSRSEAAATKLAAVVREWASDVEAVWGEEGLTRIEGSSSHEVPCCAVVLPIQAQGPIVQRLMKAGKHVLQEKPIAVSVEDARRLIQWDDAQQQQQQQQAGSGVGSTWPVWAVAENFRFEPAFHKAAELVKDLGCVLTTSVVIEVAMNAKNKYFTSEWRRETSLVGAFITDCGVHYVAALREILPGNAVVSVSAHATHMDETLPGPDNLTATMLLASGCSATLQITFCAPSNKMVWRVVCSRGVVEVSRGPSGDGRFGYQVVCSRHGRAPENSFYDFGGIDAELRAFAAAAAAASGCSSAPTPAEEEGSHRRRLSPKEALQDLAIIESCLASSKAGAGAVAVPQVVS